jgi:hypothetical protein
MDQRKALSPKSFQRRMTGRNSIWSCNGMWASGRPSSLGLEGRKFDSSLPDERLHFERTGR